MTADPDAAAAAAARAALTGHTWHGPAGMIDIIIAAARPVIEAAERQRVLAVVLKVHRKSDLGSLHCVNCQFLWPCPTIQELQSADLLDGAGDGASTAICDHEYTLNVQLTHAWCQKCGLVIPMIADAVKETIRSQTRASIRQLAVEVGARYCTNEHDECEWAGDGGLAQFADLLLPELANVHVSAIDGVAAARAAERQRIRELAIWMTTSSGTRERVVLADLLDGDTP